MQTEGGAILTKAALIERQRQEIANLRNRVEELTIVSAKLDECQEHAADLQGQLAVANTTIVGLEQQLDALMAEEDTNDSKG